MKNGSTIGLILAGVVVLVGAGFAGYTYMGGEQAAKQPDQKVVVADSSLPPSAPAAVQRHPLAPAGEYTAPGAPSIDISETKVTPKPKPTPTPAVVDSEGSESGVPATTSTDNAGATSPSTGAAPDADTSNNNNTDSSSGAPSAAGTTVGGGADSSSATGASGGGSATGAMNGGGNPNTTASDAASTAPPSAPVIAAPTYRVQAGSFQSAKNAQILEDALKHKGYTAITSEKTVDGQDSFVVQIGAYKNRVTAAEVVSSLQHDGFPASISGGN